ncbi:MAG: site-2 protease family protein [Nautilia sp.]|nr:MAG: site-2 protease family protein [Nautilia sp.]
MIEILNFTAMALALAIAVIGHEIMHGYVAKLFGDLTATYAGRLSINPLKHIDPVGTIIFPIFLYLSQKMMGVSSPIIFGWAKPVPVDMYVVIRNGGYLAGTAVSLAGVTYNFALAVVASLFIHFEPTSLISAFIFYTLYYTIVINIILMVFNLIPIPPLDGANALRFTANFFGNRSIGEFFDKIGNYGMFIVLFLLFTPLSNYIFQPAMELIHYLLR